MNECPTSPYARRNYRNDPLHRTGIKCDPRTFTQHGVVKNGVVVESSSTVEQAGDAVSSASPGGAGCVPCGG